MSKTLKIKTLKNGDTVELRELDASWSPWAYQVNRYAHKPERVRAFSRERADAGQSCCHSQSNHETLPAAESLYNNAA